MLTVQSHPSLSPSLSSRGALFNFDYADVAKVVRGGASSGAVPGDGGELNA